MQELLEYDKYRMSFREEMICAGTTGILALLAAWILYKSFWGLLLWIVIFPLYRKHYIVRCMERRKQELLIQFKDAMQCISTALMSGYSIDNAWNVAEKELTELYGKQAYMTQELHQINRGIQVNQRVEELVSQFAARSGCEDIIGFAEVFQFVKRYGGNLGKIMQNTAARISEKIEIEQEIETIIAGKKMEQKIMNIIPVCLLAYLNLTSEAFLAPLYGNFFGVLVMTIAFGAYLGTLALANYITNID